MFYGHYHGANGEKKTPRPFAPTVVDLQAVGKMSKKPLYFFRFQAGFAAHGLLCSIDIKASKRYELRSHESGVMDEEKQHFV